MKGLVLRTATVAVGLSALLTGCFDAPQTVKAGDRIAFPASAGNPDNDITSLIRMTIVNDHRGGETCSVYSSGPFYGTGREIEVVDRATAPEYRWLVRWGGSPDHANSPGWVDYCPTGAMLLVESRDLETLARQSRSMIPKAEMVARQAAQRRSEDEEKQAKIDTEIRSVPGGETAIREANEALGNRKKASPATESEKPKTSP